MAGYELGRFATSKNGHDKNKLFVIIRADIEYVYLVDGVYRTLDKPKKKKKKHIQIINDIEEALIMKYNSNKMVTNEDIKRAIKLYLTKSKV